MKELINSKTRLKQVNDVIYSLIDDRAYIYFVNKSLRGTYILPSHITVDGCKYVLYGVGKAAFHNSPDLEKLFLPHTIAYLHDEAFVGCPANIEYYSDIIDAE